MLANQGEWLEFLGALLGALVAIGLWLAEATRRYYKEKSDIATQTTAFRTAVSYALSELNAQLNQLIVAQLTLRGNADRLSGASGSPRTVGEDELNRFVAEKRLMSAIQIAPILSISIEHARFLHADENRQLASIVASARAISTGIAHAPASTGSAFEAVDTLDVVFDVVESTSRLIDSLTASLQGPRDGVQ